MRRVPILGDTRVQSRDLPDAFRIAAGLRGAGGNLIAKGLGFLNRGAGLHDGTIGNHPRHPLPEGAIARNVDWNGGSVRHEAQAGLIEVDHLTMEVHAPTA